MNKDLDSLWYFVRVIVGAFWEQAVGLVLLIAIIAMTLIGFLSFIRLYYLLVR